jgi:pimeloyl-ACP methyl ester carboxylesterase
MSRTDALTSYRDTYAALADQPTLLLWGSEDAEIPREHMEYLQRSLDNVSMVEIEGAGHGVTIQQQDEVNRHIVDFLSVTGGDE